jgi:predicted GNAT family N-acyltransferase
MRAPLLDNYIQKQAKQDVQRDLSACFVLVNNPDKTVIGYYTLSSNSVKRRDLPEDLVKKLPPSYEDLPTVLLGRLAVSNAFKGNGYGEYLLMDALNRCADISETLGTLAVIVEPIDEKAVSFYIVYGFIKLPGNGKMFITIKTIKDSEPA